MPSDYGAFLPLLNRLADAAGAAIRPFFRNIHFETKPDASPVTEADRASETVIRNLLEKERPQDGVWGEEFGVERMEAEFAWVIDPIDGTKAFLRGLPVFATLIGLMHKGECVLGLIDQPILHERWLGGTGVPATFNGQPARTRPCPALSGAVMSTSDPSFIKQPLWEKISPLVKACAQSSTGGDAYVYGLLASGHVDVVVDGGLKLHDYAALAPVITAAGGAITDWQGKPLGLHSDGRVLAVGDKRLLDEALGLLEN
ncbi:MAG TPA: inositol monophosphatase family protein [Alphaproteobacteria bacterium]|nr:inositol monophosphatase family protein [Alphaproteobacteria bacterium]